MCQAQYCENKTGLNPINYGKFSFTKCGFEPIFSGSLAVFAS